MGPNSRMVVRMCLPMASSCFSSNFTHQYVTFGKILKILKMGKKAILSFGAKFCIFSIFVSEIVAKTVFFFFRS